MSEELVSSMLWLLRLVFCEAIRELCSESAMGSGWCFFVFVDWVDWVSFGVPLVVSTALFALVDSSPSPSDSSSHDEEGRLLRRNGIFPGLTGWGAPGLGFICCCCIVRCSGCGVEGVDIFLSLVTASALPSSCVSSCSSSLSIKLDNWT